MSGNDIKKLKIDDANNLFHSSNLVFMAQNNISTIKHLGRIIKGIEKEVKSQVQLRKEFVMLTTIPAIRHSAGGVGQFYCPLTVDIGTLPVRKSK